MSVGQNIRRIRQAHNLTQEEFGKIADVSAMAVSQWENDRAVPRMGAVQRIADGLGVSKSAIIDDGAPAPSRPMMPGALPIAVGEYEYVPLRGRVHCGPWTAPENLEAREELVLAPKWVVDGDPDAYAVIAESDCMNRVIVPDQVGFVWPNAEPRNNSVVIASIDGGDALMRRMFRTAERLILSPDSTNPEHRDIVIEWASGQAVEFGGRLVHAQTNGEIG